jgi:hypothetical protein
MLVIASLTGCVAATISAPNTVQPVLLGPVHAIGEKRGERAQGERVARFTATAEHSTTVVADTQGNSSAVGGRTAPTETDWAIALYTNGNTSRELRVKKLSCSGYFFLLVLAGLSMSTSCNIDGDVFDPPQPVHPR